MAIVNTKSTTINNNLATPPVRNDSRNSSGRLRTRSETISLASGDSNTSTLRFFKVMASDTIKSIQLFNDSLAVSASTMDFGVYLADDGAVVNQDAYGTAVAMNAQLLVGAELRFETLDITTVQNAVWQDAGVATEPAAGTEYDFVGTVLARGSTPATGDITIIIQYTAGS